MACDHCVGADEFFDLKGAKKELKTYKKSGARRATKKIIELLDPTSKSGKSLLDIGGGIGVLQWSFLEKGGDSVTGVDASSGYQEIANKLSTEKNMQDKTNMVFGDFLDVHSEIKEHDVLTMDKVICCYPDYDKLISTALSKTKETVAVSFPMDGKVASALQYLGGLYMKYIEKNDYRPYSHPVAEIEKVILDNGFQRTGKAIVFPWHVRVYKRVIKC